MKDDVRQGNPRLQPGDIQKIKRHFREQLTMRLDALPHDRFPEEEALVQYLDEIYDQSGLNISPKLKQHIYRTVLDDVMGFGPIQHLLDDPSISEVMVNHAKEVYIERDGKLIETKTRFEDDEHVKRVIERIVLPLGRRIDEESPMVDARLPDGSRVNAVIPPAAIDGPSITIRKFGEDKLEIDDLIEFGSLTPTMAEFLKACVAARLNIVISGGTGSGKTTLLNILSSFIPAEDRIVTIEDSAELQLQQDHVVRLESVPPNLEGKGEVTIRSLVRNSLRMRPDRIVVGEVRGGEALDMLQAMNTGHDGSMTTVHANNPRDALARLETLALMAGLDLPLNVIREQIASAVDVIVQQARLRDGSRKVTYITEVGGMEGNTIVLTDIFKFKQTGYVDGAVFGELEPTGIRPLFMDYLKSAGFDLGPEVFGLDLSAMVDQNRSGSRKNR